MDRPRPRRIVAQLAACLVAYHVVMWLAWLVRPPTLLEAVLWIAGAVVFGAAIGTSLAVEKWARIRG